MTELIFEFFEAFTSLDFQVVLVERLKMMCRMQIHIPLKRVLTKIRMGLVQKRFKKSYKNAVGEPKVCKLGFLRLQLDSVSVYVHLPSKWEVETTIYREKW